MIPQNANKSIVIGIENKEEEVVELEEEQQSEDEFDFGML